MPAKYIVSNSISYSTLADNIISISPDVLGGNKEPQTTLIFVDDDEPYNLNLVTQQTGLSLHTKKTKQDPNVWDSACLLYTSPSPRDATLSRMPSSA